jgi:hypothetical protein
MEDLCQLNYSLVTWTIVSLTFCIFYVELRLSCVAKSFIFTIVFHLLATNTHEKT